MAPTPMLVKSREATGNEESDGQVSFTQTTKNVASAITANDSRAEVTGKRSLSSVPHTMTHSRDTSSWKRQDENGCYTSPSTRSTTIDRIRTDKSQKASAKPKLKEDTRIPKKRKNRHGLRVRPWPSSSKKNQIKTGMEETKPPGPISEKPLVLTPRNRTSRSEAPMALY